MKTKRNCILIFLVILISTSACNRTYESNYEGKTDIGQVSTSINPLNSLREGKIDGYSVSLGSNISEVIEKLGQPKETGEFMGSQYISYSNANLFYNDYVFAISFFEGTKIFGVEIGKSVPDDIRVILGTPDYEYQDTEEELDEFSTNAWKMIYSIDNYRIEFYSESKNSPVYSVYVREIKK